MWIIYSLSASVMWGLTYVINEEIFKKISPVPLLAITMFVSSLVFFAWAIMSGSMKRDWAIISASPKLILLLLAGIIVFVLAELFINFSIVDKNATMAGLIEISYPIFIVLFSYLIFRENNLNWGTLCGGAFIFTGVAIVYYFNK